MARPNGVERRTVVADDDACRSTSSNDHRERWRPAERRTVAALAAAALLLMVTATGVDSAAAEVPTAAVTKSATQASRTVVMPEVAAKKTACTTNQKLVPRCGKYFGAYVFPTGGQTQRSAFAHFQRQIRADLDIIHMYHRGSQKFPTAWEIALTERPGPDRRLLINWKPESGRTWAQVAAGKVDHVIDSEARYIRTHYKQKFFLNIHHEPEEEVRGAGSGYTARDYQRMYQRVVNRFRAAGVKNVVYVMNYMGAQKWAQKSWYKQLYPGDKYVDWIAFDPYTTPRNGTQEGRFSGLVNRHWGSGEWQGAYRWSMKHHPSKPIMLAEWGVGEKPGDTMWKARFYKSVIADAKKFPNLKAMVYFAHPKGASGNVVPSSSPQSMSAFRRLASSSIFM